MNMVNKRDMSYILVVLVITIIALAFYFNNKKLDELENNTIYTFGRITDSYPVIGYFNFDYSFIYNDKEYYGTNSSNKNLENEINRNFIVKYSKNNPDNSKLIVELPVCDSITELSQMNWESIPKRIICP